MPDIPSFGNVKRVGIGRADRPYFDSVHINSKNGSEVIAKKQDFENWISNLTADFYIGRPSNFVKPIAHPATKNQFRELSLINLAGNTRKVAMPLAYRPATFQYPIERLHEHTVDCALYSLRESLHKRLFLLVFDQNDLGIITGLHQILITRG